MLLNLLDHRLEIGIASAKLPCEPVPAPLGNPFAVGDHLELAGLTSGKEGINS